MDVVDLFNFLVEKLGHCKKSGVLTGKDFGRVGGGGIRDFDLETHYTEKRNFLQANI